MSEYGLKIVNDSSSTVIDSVYQNFQLHDSGSVSLSNPAGVSSTPITVNFSSPTVGIPMVVFTNSSSSVYCGVVSYVVSGSNCTGFTAICRLGYSTTLYWKCFSKKNSTGSSDAYGVRIYSSSGNIVFDGGYRNLLIRETHSITLPAFNVGVTINHGTYDNPYYLIGDSGFGVVLIPIGYERKGVQACNIGILKQSANSVFLSYFPVFNAGVVQGPSDPGIEFFPTQMTFQVLICEESN